MAASIGWKKRILFSALATALGLCLLEGACSFAWLVADYVRHRQSLPIATQFKEEFHTVHDPELGWAHVPGKQIGDFYGPGRHLTINRDGLRGREDDADGKPPGRFRVLCLGDSFTLGYGVDDRATYPAQLQALRPRVQALNMGQGGYSIGQCYLWYRRDGQKFNADCVVFALILDDIWRLTHSRLINGAAMPVFEQRDGRLRVSGQPVPKKVATGRRIAEPGALPRFLVEHSALLRALGCVIDPMKEKSAQRNRDDLVMVALAVLRELHREASARQTPLVVVLMPELRELVDPTSAQTYRVVARVLKGFCASRGIAFLDLSDALAQAAPTDPGRFYLPEHWHHFSEAGNRLVAEHVDAYLASHVPGYPDSPGPHPD